MTPEERHIKRLEELLKQTPKGFIYDVLMDRLTYLNDTDKKLNYTRSKKRTHKDTIKKA